MVKVYISGAMTGIKNLNKPAFKRAEEMLTKKGYEVVNPHELGLEGKSWEDAMRVDISKMLECEMVAVLPNWKNSLGTQMELLIAEKVGMPILDAKTLKPVNVVSILKVVEIQSPLKIAN
jgi:hypothetical protein